MSNNPGPHNVQAFDWFDSICFDSIDLFDSFDSWFCCVLAIGGTRVVTREIDACCCFNSENTQQEWPWYIHSRHPNTQSNHTILFTHTQRNQVKSVWSWNHSQCSHRASQPIWNLNGDSFFWIKPLFVRIHSGKNAICSGIVWTISMDLSWEFGKMCVPLEFWPPFFVAVDNGGLFLVVWLS